MSDTKIFWKTIKLYFSGNGLAIKKVILNGKENKIKGTQVLNSHFVKITQYLNMAQTNDL